MTADLVPLLHRLPRGAAPSDRLSVAVIGTGYVGLVTGACLAALGHQVTCVDRDAAKIATLKAGEVPFYEPGLAELIERAGDRLRFTDRIREGVAEAAIVFIAVGTPPLADGRPDLTQLMSAVAEIAPCLSPEAVVVIKSTVPVGTAAEAETLLLAGSPHGRISIASNPEFLREGSAIADFLHADRIVIGVADERAGAALRRLYAPLGAIRIPLVVTARPNAELIKYAANGFLAVKIAFINEIADLCERIGGDIADVAAAIGMDERIGGAFLRAGPGYGGSCFPKDTRALADLGSRSGVSLRIVEAAVESNRVRVARLVDRLLEANGGSLEGVRVALLGLAFKPNTDDVRESPALSFVDAVRRAGGSVRGCDPKAVANAQKVIPDLVCVRDPYAACKHADVLVVMTDWEAFRFLDLARLRSVMNGDLIVDFRNQFDPTQVARHGFRYVSVGRAPAAPAETKAAVQEAPLKRATQSAQHGASVPTGLNLSGQGIATP